MERNVKHARPLKHYRRRRFLHKFLMMDSPRSADLMGLGLLFLALLLRMFGYLAVIRLVLVSGFGPASLAAGLLLTALYALLLGAAMLFIGGGKYEGIRRWRARDLLTLGHWKKCWNVLFAAGAVPLFVAGGETPLTLAAVLFLLVLAVVFAPDGRRIKTAAFIPVLLAVLVLAGMFCTARFLERDIRSRLVRLAGIVGGDAPVSLAAYDAREGKALSVKREPLKTLAETEPEASFFVWYHSFDEMQKDLARLRRENPRYPAAVERFLALPAGSVREEIDPETGTYVCSCGLLRTAARFQALLIGCARDKETAIRADANLRKLAAWCIGSHSVVARLVGISVEKIRLPELFHEAERRLRHGADVPDPLEMSQISGRHAPRHVGEEEPPGRGQPFDRLVLGGEGNLFLQNEFGESPAAADGVPLVQQRIKFPGASGAGRGPRPGVKAEPLKRLVADGAQQDRVPVGGGPQQEKVLLFRPVQARERPGQRLQTDLFDGDPHQPLRSSARRAYCSRCR